MFLDFLSVGDRLSILTPSHASYDIDSADNFDLQPGSHLDADWGSDGDAETHRDEVSLSQPALGNKAHLVLPEGHALMVWHGRRAWDNRARRFGKERS